MVSPSTSLVGLSTLLAVISCAVIGTHARAARAAVDAKAPTYSTTYLPYDTPKHSEPGQYGTNQVRGRYRLVFDADGPSMLMLTLLVL